MKNHHADALWDGVVQRIAAEIAQRELHPSAVVVLVPYAQLMAIGRLAWMRAASNGEASAAFIPRFETTHNWCRGLGGFTPSGDDVRQDAAIDVLTASTLLQRAGLATQRRRLAGRLMDAVWSLARVAAAVPPAGRAAWGQRMADQLGVPDAVSPLHLNVWLGRIALAWAAGSAYATDRLFDAPVDLLVMLQGFQVEPLQDSLRNRLAERCLCLPLDVPAPQGRVVVHQAHDAEDEAERAAACVLQHLAAGRSPVALVAQDRFLVRRVRAMLDECGVALRDETGWTLSTTRSAATVMGLVRAMSWDASGDAVLDWLKNAPAFDPLDVASLEARMRRSGNRDWRAVEAQPGLIEAVNQMQHAMQAARPIGQWLHDLRKLLETCGLWRTLRADAAGHALLEAASLREAPTDDF
ncbi:MAG: PD-(D/E)XK nuclease family protein, partial [Burkholderiaceae bacterium]